MALQQEISMAFARAVAVGFAIEHMADLMIFAEQFCATHLRSGLASSCLLFCSIVIHNQNCYILIAH